LGEEAPFDVILLVWTTILEYYNHSADIEIIRGIRRLLRKGGLFIVTNTASYEFLAHEMEVNLVEKVYSNLGDSVVIEQHKLDPVKRKMATEWKFYRKRGEDLIYVDKVSFEIELSTIHELVRIVESSGFKLIRVYKSMLDMSSVTPLSRST